MKLFKMITAICLAVAVVLSCSFTAFATENVDQRADVAIIIADESGAYPGAYIRVVIRDVDSGETVSTIDLTKENSWGYNRGVLIGLPVQRTYEIIIDYISGGYKVINTLSGDDAAATFELKEDGCHFSWSIVEDETSKGGNNAITSTDRGGIVIENEEAEAVYQAFLQAVSFIETDETWYEGTFGFLSGYMEGSLNGSLYAKWYAKYVQGGTNEEYYAMSAFEQFVWTETYTRFAYAVNSGSFSYYFGSEQAFSSALTRIVTDIMKGNNVEAVKEAYLKLADWQYEYIKENGVPFNFINNRSYIKEMNPPEEETPVETTKKEGTPVVSGDSTENKDDAKTDDKADEKEPGIWTDTLEVLAKNALAILIVLVLAGAVCVVIYIRKRKNEK